VRKPLKDTLQSLFIAWPRLAALVGDLTQRSSGIDGRAANQQCMGLGPVPVAGQRAEQRLDTHQVTVLVEILTGVYIGQVKAQQIDGHGTIFGVSVRMFGEVLLVRMVLRRLTWIADSTTS